MDKHKTNGAAEGMRYEMVGQDTSSLEDKLAKYGGRAVWKDLSPHLDAGTLVYVDPALVLDEVAVAFAKDERTHVADWLAAGDLVKPSTPHGAYWQSINAEFLDIGIRDRAVWQVFAVQNGNLIGARVFAPDSGFYGKLAAFQNNHLRSKRNCLRTFYRRAQEINHHIGAGDG